MDMIGIPSILTIIIIISGILKTTFKDNEKMSTLLPMIAALLGGVLSVVGFYIMPDMSVSENVMQALMYGLLTGLSATGSMAMYTNFKTMHEKSKELKVIIAPTTEANDEAALTDQLAESLTGNTEEEIIEEINSVLNDDQKIEIVKE